VSKIFSYRKHNSHAWENTIDYENKAHLHYFSKAKGGITIDIQGMIA